MQFIDLLGFKFINQIRYTIDLFLMVYLSLRSALKDQAQGLRSVFCEVSAQIYFTGWQAMPIITVLALASGSVVILQSQLQVNFLGGSGMVGKLLVAIIVREVSPLLTALVVIARSGTAVASELGNMRVNNETEALRVMGINPLSYIVFPRIMGGYLSVLALAFYFIIIALFGGFLATSFIHDMSLNFYLNSLAQSFEVEDVLLFLLKNSFSGIMIFVICCFQGLSVKKSPHEVPQVTTKAVMDSIIYVISFNMIVTVIFYLSQLRKLGVL